MTKRFETVYLSQEEFSALPNYSCSEPTGITFGKRWKRAKCYYNQTDDPEDWYMGEYLEGPDPSLYMTRYRLIRLGEPSTIESLPTHLL